ncbi:MULTISPECIES: GNAT family N-acetyltransferase [Streptomyces]|uniref:N-acetyltransferase n=1 Tax=Streptomyces tsukubensis (strain DSM 42081 / NBRC 108919 / NRRL 18488 / 9993) TaxID=1114943 RepID=A0A7G3UJS8_STRT9|nr:MULTISPECIES: GNAT family N-acetyltransferase [Streptomyces]AZK94318.1 N-acetyltransferase [Streptomyces tsukubensis]MYS62779.1 GNAT family N-acetyltransferase [Streptomyces sp. SID5473]QKM69589.1 N-acetyltransferase [Streptomyces tsukubensis NRRL18488]TAI46451.1 N-acetyltransferase [Streptomyces tsukubensis]
MEPITLTTGRLLLRPFTDEDTEEVFRLCQDAAVQRWTTIPSPYERRHAEEFTGEIAPEGWRTSTMFTFAVAPLGGGPPMASSSVTLRTLSGIWEIGFWLGAEHRGRGIMTEAVTELARWSFTRLGATRLEWRAEVGNTASRAVALRAGFRMEGTLRAALDNNGTLRDAWLASLLPSDLGLAGSRTYLPAPVPAGP